MTIYEQTLKTLEAQFKTSMAANLAGITVDLKQGQVDKARKQFEAFQARFRTLSETCNGCHDKRSRYYVDSDTQDTLEEIGRALSSGNPETHTVGIWFMASVTGGLLEPDSVLRRIVLQKLANQDGLALMEAPVDSALGALALAGKV